MTRFVLLLEYDGTAYAGFQLQSDARTVQGEVEKVLQSMYRETVRVIPSGRTDAGVHARYQVLHFDAPKVLHNLNLKAAMNAGLPPDIRVLNYSVQNALFHARYSAKRRCYRYLISKKETALERDRVWQIFQPLNAEAMRECAGMLKGEHDFTAFCSAQAEVKHKRCIIDHAEWTREEDLLHFDICGNRFLHSMVRSLVGTMVEVGKGRLNPQQFRDILESRNRLAGALTAPPQGLYLMQVAYEPDLIWEI
jgi:tRNA pseudouridine38-40 synthase